MSKIIHYRTLRLWFAITIAILSLQSIFQNLFDFTNLNLFGMTIFSISVLAGLSGLWFMYLGFNGKLRLF